MKIRNTFIIFLVSGFWHGANWTFIVWGALNGLYFLPLLLAKKNRKNLDTVAKGRLFPTAKESFQILFTFGLTVLAWIFFRAENIFSAFRYISGIFSSSLFSIPHHFGGTNALITIVLTTFFVLIEWKGREEQYAIANLGLKWNPLIRYAMYYSFIIAIFTLSLFQIYLILLCVYILIRSISSLSH